MSFTRTNTAKWLPKYNRWQINVQRDGKRRSFTSGKPGRAGQREANAKADRWINQGLINDNMTVRELYDKFMEEKRITVGTSRYKNIQSDFNQRIFPYIENKKVSRLTEQDLQNILNDLFVRGYSFESISDTRSLLNQFVKFGRKCSVTDLRPENLEINKKAPKGFRSSLQPEDIRILFTSDKSMRYGVVIQDEWIHAYRFLIVTGLRRGEMLGLKWSDVKEHTIEIKRSLNEYKELTEGKTVNAIRTIPLTEIAKSILSQVERKGEYIFNDDYLSVVPATFSCRFKKYAEYNGLSTFRVHELRHTFVSLMDSALPLNVLKDVVGHSKSMDTVGQYGHVVDGEMEKSSQIINSKFSSILTVC